MYKVPDFTLAELQQGSDDVLQKVYNQNRDKFINFARRYNVGEEDIIDAYQDAYIVFYNNVKKGKITELTSSVSTYLFSIGKHIIFDKIKKNAKTINPDFEVTLLQKDEVTDFEVSSGLSPEQKLLQKHFSSLGKKCQELLTLFYYNGLTVKEILESTSYETENVVKSSKSRCLKTLKERINSPKE